MFPEQLISSRNLQTLLVTSCFFFFFVLKMSVMFARLFIFIFDCAGSSLLRTAFTCSETGVLFLGCRVWTYCGGFSRCRARALGVRAQELWHMGLGCPMACGIFPEQGSNLFSLHWQADSYPLEHQGVLHALSLSYLLMTICGQSAYCLGIVVCVPNL